MTDNIDRIDEHPLDLTPTPPLAADLPPNPGPAQRAPAVAAGTPTHGDSTRPTHARVPIKDATVAALDGVATGLRDHRLGESLDAAILEGAVFLDAAANGWRRGYGSSQAAGADTAQEVPYGAVAAGAGDDVDFATDGRAATTPPGQWRPPRPGAATARVERVRKTVRRAVDRTQAGAEALAETSKRAAKAPGLVARDLGGAAGAYARGYTRMAVNYAVMGVLGLGALILFTVALAVGLNRVLGSPWGTAIVGLLYVVGAGIAMAMAKAAQVAAKREATIKIEHAKAEVHAIADPWRRFLRPSDFDGRRMSPPQLKDEVTLEMR